MKAAVAVIGILFMTLGAMGVIRPRRLVQFAERFFQRRSGKYIVAGSRFIVGAVFLLAASECRFPDLIRNLWVSRNRQRFRGDHAQPQIYLEPDRLLEQQL